VVLIYAADQGLSNERKMGAIGAVLSELWWLL
jgi:hypothetical protein